MSNFTLVPGTLGETIFKDKYAFPGEEEWKDCAKRVANAIAMAEPLEDRDVYEKKFYEAINSGDFCPGGRILFGAGRLKYNMLNCYVLDPEDTVESIGSTVSNMYKISCAGGGIGFNFSKIRPKGADIQNIKYSAPGTISTMKMINEIGTHVRAGKNRRTALMAILNVSHPDLFEFLNVKLDRKELTNFNISVAITDRFLEAVNNDEEWYFTFGGRHNRYYVFHINRVSELGNDSIRVVAKTKEDALGVAQMHHLKHYQDKFEEPIQLVIKAKDIWNSILTNATECGEPGIFNIDFTNSYTNVSYFEFMPSVNPCGEIPLSPFSNCCLGHINLSNMFTEKGEVDWKRLARTIRTGVRFLDNVLTTNTFPIPECKEAGLRSRRIGLGVTGFHYFLIKAGYRYGNEECLEFVERLFGTIKYEAYKASMNLARYKGSFEAYDWSKLSKEKFFKTLPSRLRTEIRLNGLRNAVMLTSAPTGTISMVLGVSTGIEPIFAPIYKRRWRSGTEGVWNETIVIDPLFKKMYLEGKNIEHIVGAYDVTPEEHIRMQATIQQFIDSAVSKTCNLPSTFTLTDEIKQTLTTFAADIKGFTFYKAGSRGNEPLSIIDPKSVNLDELIINENSLVQTESVRDCATGACEI